MHRSVVSISMDMHIQRFWNRDKTGEKETRNNFKHTKQHYSIFIGPGILVPEKENVSINTDKIQTVPPLEQRKNLQSILYNYTSCFCRKEEAKTTIQYTKNIDGGEKSSILLHSQQAEFFLLFFFFFFF